MSNRPSIISAICQHPTAHRRPSLSNVCDAVWLYVLSDQRIHLNQSYAFASRIQARSSTVSAAHSGESSAGPSARLLDWLWLGPSMIRKGEERFSNHPIPYNNSGSGGQLRPRRVHSCVRSSEHGREPCRDIEGRVDRCEPGLANACAPEAAVDEVRGSGLHGPSLRAYTRRSALP